MKKTSLQSKSEKFTFIPQRAKRVTPKRRVKKKKNTVFMVNLPLSRGDILLKRTSFSPHRLTQLSASASSDLSPISKSEILDCELESDAASFAVKHDEDGSEYQTLQPEQELYERDVNSEGQVTFTDVENVADCVNDITGTEECTAYGEWGYNRCDGSQERSSNEFHRNWNNEDLQTKSEGMFPAVLHTKDQIFDSSYYRQEEGGAKQLHISASVINYETEMEGSKQKTDMGWVSSAVQPHHHHQQPPQNQQMLWNDGTLQAGSMWGHHGVSGEVASYIDVARKNLQTSSEDNFLHSGSVSQEQILQFHDTDDRRLETCSRFTINHSQTGPASYMTQSTSYPVSQMDRRLMPYSNLNTAPGTNPVQPFAYPVSSNNMAHANAAVQPWQPVYYGGCSAVYF